MAQTLKTNKENEKYYEELVKSVIEDFNERRKERFETEKQWQLNLNYLAGNQYAEIMPTGEVVEEQKYYFWQSRNVYNHIAPVIDIRLAKLSNVRPIMSVRASSSDDSDLKTAEISSEILNSTYARLRIDEKINEACNWSENCGTVFYKIIWNSQGGKLLSDKNNEYIYDGDVDISVVPPFEIFPDSLFRNDIESCKSIIHAKAMNVDDVKTLYGVTLVGEDIDVFTLSSSGMSYNGGFKQSKISSSVKNSVLVIEKYESPSSDYPNGRVITVAGNKLLQMCELPYINASNNKRGYPFVRQISLLKPGAFFGTSLIERLIPVQRAYNAVKNRKQEFINRLSMGVVTVEDGSVDVDELADEGLSPGKILVYRQGSKAPGIMSMGNVPIDFTYEEERLMNEFINISGSSEISRMTNLYSSNLSGTAIELILEQDESRMNVTIDSLKNAIKNIGKHVLRLFKQFAVDTKIMKSAGDNKKVKLFYFKSSDITSDDIVFDTENEVTRSPAQKKSSILELLNLGLLSDKGGIISDRTKSKLLDILGYGSLENVKDLASLHRGKAEKENIEMLKTTVEVDDYDDHDIHVDEHLRKLLTLDKSKENLDYKNRLNEHIKNHKKLLFIVENQNNLINKE